MKTTFKEYIKESKFKSQLFQTYEEVEHWLVANFITDYEINEHTLEVSVSGFDGVNIRNSKFEYLPVQFDIVEGNFNISDCAYLKSLEGCPIECRQFTCEGCINIKTLKGAPLTCTDFDCSRCMSLTSLENGPKKVKYTYDCRNCYKLTSLKGLPSELRSSLTALESPIKSISGLDKILHSCANMHIDLKDIKGGILSLLKIKDLIHINAGRAGLYPEERKISEIINRFLPEGDIFKCQQELIDAGFEEQAQL